MKPSRISDEAVHKATGKNLKQWFSILDKAGAKKMPHRDIARFVYDNYLGKPKKKDGVNVTTNGGWWSQMVTVEYERARGLRAVNENANGFVVSIHKTVPGSITSLQKKWNMILKSKEVAAKKLVKKPSKTKRIMLRYQAEAGQVIVSFDERGEGKARIMVEAARLSKKSLIEPERAFWKKMLSKYFDEK